MTHTEKVQQEVREYLDTPASFPLVQAEPHEQMNLLIRRAFIAKDRRFHPEPQPITGFGALE